MIPVCGVVMDEAERSGGVSDLASAAERALLVEAGVTFTATGMGALLNQESVTAALLDSDGRIVPGAASSAWAQAPPEFDREVLARVLRSKAPQMVVSHTPGGTPDDAGGNLSILAYGVAGCSLHWALPEAVRRAATARPHDVVVLAGQATANTSPLDRACMAYGLTGLQTRVALAAVRTGSIKAAARLLGIAYDTAREALAGALERAQAPRLPALVSRLVALAFGVTPQADSGRLIGDLWGLSPRQAAISLLVADGAEHAEAGRALGCSTAVVKKELKLVYQLLQVSSSAALARKLQETIALAWMTAATGGDVDVAAGGAEPLRFVYREDGRRIAVSDYGPASGRPVLVVHSSMTTRIVGNTLKKALQAAGYRPISIDRPGFGLTEEVAGLVQGRHDPFRAAAPDALLVLRHLRLDKIDVVARGAAQFVVALHDLAPEVLDRVVLVNPDPPSRRSGGTGPAQATKAAFARNPDAIRLWAALFASQITYARVSRVLDAWLAGSPPDQKAAREGRIAPDYFRAVQTFATGRYGGFVNEQVEFARGRAAVPTVSAVAWRVLIGAHDTIHDPRRVVAYWGRHLPNADIEVVAQAGRLLALTHPELVVQALEELGRRR